MTTEIRLKLKLRYATVQRPANLSDLDDVFLTAIQDNQVLMYDSMSDTWYNVTLPNFLVFQGDVNVAADFPDPANVENGWTYLVKSDVTDNDPTRTNTGQSFLADEEIAWNGTDWTQLGISSVKSIFGRTGVVSADSTDYEEFYIAKTLQYNDQRGNGTYVIQPTDSAKMVIVDDAITVPAGLPDGFQCAIAQANASAQSLTIDGSYTTVIGSPEANVSPDTVATIGVVNSTTVIFSGVTEA